MSKYKNPYFFRRGERCAVCGYRKEAGVHLPHERPWDHAYAPMSEAEAKAARKTK